MGLKEKEILQKVVVMRTDKIRIKSDQNGIESDGIVKEDGSFRF